MVFTSDDLNELKNFVNEFKELKNPVFEGAYLCSHLKGDFSLEVKELLVRCSTTNMALKKIPIYINTGSKKKRNLFNEYFSTNPNGIVLGRFFEVTYIDDEVEEGTTSIIANSRLKATVNVPDNVIVIGNDTGIDIPSLELGFMIINGKDIPGLPFPGVISKRLINEFEELKTIPTDFEGLSLDELNNLAILKILTDAEAGLDDDIAVNIIYTFSAGASGKVMADSVSHTSTVLDLSNFPIQLFSPVPRVSGSGYNSILKDPVSGLNLEMLSDSWHVNNGFGKGLTRLLLTLIYNQETK